MLRKYLQFIKRVSQIGWTVFLIILFSPVLLIIALTDYFRVKRIH